MQRIAVPTLLLVGMLVLTLSSGPMINGTATALAQASGAGGSPIVEITKTCPSLRYLGREATFEITVVNKGDGTAQNVVVTDQINGNIQFRAADNNGQREGNNIVWRLGELAAGQTKTLKSTFLCNAIGKIQNSATVTYCAEARDECELEVRGIPAVLLECVDDPDPIEVNGELTYTITVTNQGTAVGTGIEIKCTLPAEEQYIAADGPTKAETSGQVITFAPVPTLAPKAKAVFKLRVKGVAEGDVRFRVEMNSDQIGEPVMETESTHIYE
ncbi:MAG: DUF11 domain-containing protein [Phycisphaerae bacterium]|nr:DUF11 domain-containing protein [Phycisphaerae bacterium]